MKHKSSGDRLRLTANLLNLINNASETKNLIKYILHLIKDYSKIEAVGIRLREGNDFPYYATEGFDLDFVEAERYLCSRDAQGDIIREKDGSVYHECMCGNVINGRFDPAQAFFTKGGSFWTNSTTDLLAETTEEDRQARTRNRCHAEGYESVALVVLRSGNTRIGLLQLNDHQKDMFFIDEIKFFEQLGESISIAFERLRAQKQIQEYAVELARRNLRYKAALEVTGAILFDWSVKADEVEFFGQLKELLGLNPSQLKGSLSRWIQRIDPDGRAAFDLEMKHLGVSGEFFELTYLVLKNDGDYLPIINKGRAYRNKSGALVRVIGCAFDASGKKGE